VKSFREEREHSLESIKLTYNGRRYTGNGSMTWSPEEGFHIRGLLNKEPPDHTGVVTFGGFKLETPYSILLKPQGYDRAIAQHVPPTSSFSLLMNNYLSVKVRRVVFFQFHESTEGLSDWGGSAMLQLVSSPILPDRVERETSINGLAISASVSMEGIRHEEDDLTVVAYVSDKHDLELVWRLPKDKWTKKQNWSLPEAARDAFSILTGQTVRLRRRETDGNRFTRTEFCQPPEAIRLPSYLHPIDIDILPKDTFIRLTSFFTRKERHSRTCIKIFRQMVEAARQQNWQAKELLLATILEAALRNIDGHGFAPGDKSFKIDVSAKSFQENFLSGTWTQPREAALKTMRRLRHRNAHPDWLLGQGGYMSKENQIQSINDLTFLSRFYGYMILALAGVRDLEPIFPAPYTE
jgi:hypothetical protein